MTIQFENRGNQEQKSQTIGQKFFEESKKSKNSLVSKAYEYAARELGQGNFDMSQRYLESNIPWNDDLRRAAVEINKLDLERIGEPPMSFNEVKSQMTKQAENIRNNFQSKDAESQAANLDSIARGLSRPGVDSIDEALKYCEDYMKDLNDSLSEENNKFLAEDIQQLKTLRKMRDVLVLEKHERIEKKSDKQEKTKGLDASRQETTRKLKNIYAEAGIPEEIPSRQKLMNRIVNMSEQELSFLGQEITNTARKFQRTRDVKGLDSALFDLASREFTLQAVKKREEEEGRQKITEIRSSVGLEDFGASKNPELTAEKVEELPDNTRELHKYAKKYNFLVEAKTAEEFRQAFTPEIQNEYKKFLEQYVKAVIKEKTGAGLYPDNMAFFAGSRELGVLQRIIASKEGKIINLNKLETMPYSMAAKEYFGTNIPDDYFQQFSRRTWRE